MSCDFRKPFEPDEDTVALYHFDEGAGNEAHEACGDPELTLRANEKALWGSRPGFGTTARFNRQDAHLLVGPTNNDKLELRTCTEEWTIEAWVRYTGTGAEEFGYTYANICATDEEGFSLPTGIRAGWSFFLQSPGAENQPVPGQPPPMMALEQGILPGSRFMGSMAGRDPNHDCLVWPASSNGWLSEDRGCIRDRDWHHVAWQFRYRDQLNTLFIDGKLIRQLWFPDVGTAATRIIRNDADRCDIPFHVGGFPHSKDPVGHFGLTLGNLEGEIDELRISRVMRYPVTHHLAVMRQKLPEAGLRIPFGVALGADRAAGRVTWAVTDGALPEGLSLDRDEGVVRGTPAEVTTDREVTIEAKDESGQKDRHTFAVTVAPGCVTTESLPPAFVGSPCRVALQTKHMAEPFRWEVVEGALPEGVVLNAATGELEGTPAQEGPARFAVRATDANGTNDRRDLVLRALPEELRVIGPDEHTVVLYDWKGPGGREIRECVIGDDALTLACTNMGGDRRVPWPGREGRFPQETGHGEHGYATVGKGIPEVDLKTCAEEWTVEAWIRRGGQFQAYDGDIPPKPFDYGHICGTYDNGERGVWELYISDHGSPDGSMAPGVHFQSADYVWKDLHPWARPEAIVGHRAEAGISDTEWHHVAWQYGYAEDLHQLFVDGSLIWEMQTPDGRRLVNDRKHEEQFSVLTRLTSYCKFGKGDHGDHEDGEAHADSGGFNYLGWGNFFGQVGEIRISNIRRYGHVGDSKTGKQIRQAGGKA